MFMLRPANMTLLGTFSETTLTQRASRTGFGVGFVESRFLGTRGAVLLQFSLTSKRFPLWTPITVSFGIVDKGIFAQLSGFTLQFCGRQSLPIRFSNGLCDVATKCRILVRRQQRGRG